MSLQDVQPEIYKRKLQFHERRYYRAPNSALNVMFRIKGKITEKQLRHAILKAQQRHVLLRARVFMDKESNVWLTTENVKDIPIDVIKRSNDNQWLQVYLNDGHIPLDYCNRPPLKFILLYSKDVSDLIVKASHMFTDFLGVCYLTRDILEFLGDTNKKVKILPPPPLITRDNIPSNVPNNFIIRSVIKIINKIWMKRKVVFDEEDYKNIYKAYWETYTSKSFNIDLSKDETLKLMKRCRKENVTVNSALIAAFIRAQSMAKGVAKKQNGSFSVDLRNKLVNPIGQSFGVYATGVFLSIKDKSGKSFWDFSKNIHKCIIKKMDKQEYHINLLRFYNFDSSINDAAIMKMHGHLVKKGYSRYDKLSSYCKKKDIISLILKIDTPRRFGFSMINPGRLDFVPKYGNLELDKVFLLPLTAPNIDVIISVATAVEKLSLRLSYIEKIIDDEIVKKIKDNMLNIVNQEILK
jgi:NRPS condensation-like uncharacterized protein